MSRTSEAGRGRLSTLFWLAVFAALGYAAFNVGPVYIANYTLEDKLQDVARTPRSTKAEAAISQGIRDAIKDANLSDYLDEHDFRVVTAEATRTITAEYDREANVLPGMRRTFHMEVKAEQRFF